MSEKNPPQPSAPAGPPGGAQAPVPNVRLEQMKFRDADFLGLDPRTIKPELHYRWVRVDSNGRSVVRKKARGYHVVTQKDGVRTLVEADKRADGAIVIGDSVLMACPRQLHEERQRFLHKRSEDILASTSANTEEEAKRKGVRIIRSYEGGPGFTQG